jgi:phage shock protein PspC (stress-responsive transcriptional regulator)
MKKNISINISGIIFHIEEDGFESLRKYLDSINRYFASFEDSSEILADIESRIAEIFLAKLNEGKQVITAEDVNSLIATMGSVNDFKAAEEQEFAATDFADASGKSQNQSSYNTAKEATKKLYRDKKHKILGGVCGGLGHYFNIDPVWPRLLFALLVLGSYGSLLIVYIIFWIALPASDDLEDEPSVKKMYRDPERKVIGGVASGVALFFGIDLALTRILFVVFAIFGGLGLLVYIILWIALPEAKTITEKMQMQGEPVTLSNIESTVKKGLNQKEDEEENVITKIVLFPFRVIALVINGIASALGPVFKVIIDVLRTFIGIIITLSGLAMIFALIVSAGIVFGFISLSSLPAWTDIPVSEIGLPMEALRNSFSNSTVFFAFLVALIPTLFIILIGNSIIAKRIIFNSLTGWTLFVLFFVSVAIVSIKIPQIVYAFKEEGEYRAEQTYTMNGKTAVLRIQEVGLDDYDMTSLNIKGYEGTDLKLVKRFEAQGNTRKVAIENAQMVEYNVQQTDSILTFDSNILFKKDAKFRAQRLNMDLYIPYGSKFVIEEAMWRMIDNSINDYDGYRDSNFDKTWLMTKSGFECLNCTEPLEKKKIELRDQFGLVDFTVVDLSGFFDVSIEQGEAFAVELSGSEKEKKRYQLTRENETLVIEYNDKSQFFWKRDLFEDDKVKITITMPELKEMKAKGAGNLKLNGFREEDIEVELTGAITGVGDFESQNLTIELNGASSLELKGQGDFMEANMNGACTLKAYNYEVKHAIIEANGACSAKVSVTEKLEIDKGIASSVSHRGDPQVIERN